MNTIIYYPEKQIFPYTSCIMNNIYSTANIKYDFQYRNYCF